MRVAKVSSTPVGTNTLPTAPIPEDLKAKPIRLTENARTVLQKRYLRRGPDGKPAENEHEMFWRVAYHVALAEREFADPETVMTSAREYFDLLTNLYFFPNSPTFTGAGTPLGQLAACFTGTMRVTTNNGFKPISELQPGELVLTHKGRYRPVKAVYFRDYSGTLLKIKVGQIGAALEVTPEHPILTPNGWVNAGELKAGDWVAIGMPQENYTLAAFDLAALPYPAELEIQQTVDAVRVRRPATYQNSGRQANWSKRYLQATPELARLAGYYVSEGTMGTEDRYVRFTFSSDETEYHQDVQHLIHSIFGVEPTVIQSNHGNWVQIDLYSRAATQWFRQEFGVHSYGKKLPTWLQFADRDIQQEFLIGVLRGDGLFSEKTYATKTAPQGQIFRTLRLVLSNPSLIHQIWQMCLRMGYDASTRPVDTTYVTPTARPTASLNIPPIQAQELVQAAFGQTFSPMDKRYSRNKAMRIDGQAYFRIDRIESESFTGKVYNCEVEDDHTYVTEGVVVHNCFVLAIDDDMGRVESGIFQTLRDAALIQQTGGGNGFAFSRLRPKGAIVKSSGGEATGPVGFLRVYDQAFGEIAQGGCLTPDTLVFTDSGTLRLDEIVRHEHPGWVDHALIVATDEGRRSSPRAYNNGIAPVLRIVTDAGIEITGTPNHKVKIMTENGPAWRRLDELQPGDSVMVKLGEHRGTLQALRKPEKAHGNQIMPQFPPVLDEEFAFFMGYMAGDGFVAAGEDDHRVGVTVAHTSYLYDEMPALMGRIFGTHLTVHRQQKSNDASVTYTFDNRAIKDFLAMNGLTKGQSIHTRIPRLIRQSTPEVVGAYLRGLFEADGALSHGYPMLVSTSHGLLREVATLLIGLGCPVTIRQQETNESHYGTNDLWTLRINSFVGLKAWQAKISCDPRSRFAEIAQPTREFAFAGQPVPAGIIPADFAEYARPVNDVWFVQVESVQAAGESLTLDIEVEGNHTYLANGIVTHNSRRGANMAVLRVDHPDVIEFVTCKTDESHITNFNISVGITDAFMQAVEADEDFDLINPQDGKVWRTVRARELFDLIVKQAHHNGEPGVLFLDEANRHNPVPHLYTLESTNPCVIGTTRVPTEHGLLTIAELAALETGLMVGTDGRAPFAGRGLPSKSDFGVAYRQSSPAWQTRTQTPVLKLTTQHGYTLTATPDHKILTVDRGYVPLADLKPGDQLLLQSGEGAWGKNYALPNVTAIRELMTVMAHGGDHASGATVQRRDFAALYQNLPETWSHELGLAIGWLVGDGWLSPDSGSPVGMVFDEQAPEVLETVHGVLTQWFGSGHLHKRDSVWQLTYGRLPYMFFHTLGVKAVPAHEKCVPHTLWAAPREAVVGFLQGLFTADGTVNLSEEKKSCDVRLASSSKQLLEDVQLLLLNFGVVSKIHLRREAGYRAMPDGKGGQKDYFAHADYELLIDKANRDRFMAEIGFIEQAKQDKAARFIEAKARRSNRETFMTKVVRIEDAGLADVYDLTEPQTSSFIANGLVIHNCGEQFLGPFENCCLGSINLAKLDLKKGQPDWGMLQRIVETSTRFLDDVVSANSYVPAVPQLAQAAHRVRRIGLGIMGLADLMYKLGVRYGSQEGQEFAGQIMEFVRYHAMKTSIELAKERGAFPAIEGSIYDPANLKWQPPKPLFPYTRDWGRPALDWSKIVKGIKKHGIRNGAQTTIAPTGTIATVSGCEGYGCEPVFALAYIRHVNDKGQDLKLQYTSPLFEKALKDAKLSDAQIAAIIEHVNMTGSCQKAPGLPESLRHTFVVSSDVSAEEHIYMQAALQRFTDNAISKCVTGDTLVLTANGLTPIEELSEMRLDDQFEDMKIDVVTPYGVEPTNAFFYGGKKETRKVRFSYGYKIEGTPNHRVQVLDTTGQIRFARLDELKIGDTVVLYAGQQVFGPANQPLPEAALPKRPNAKPVRFPERMSRKLAYLLGCLTSEGYIGQHGVGITNGDRSLLEKLGRLFEEIFGLSGLSWNIAQDMRRESVYTLQVNSRVLRDWLVIALDMRRGAAKKFIPTCILRASRDEIAAFLRGLFLDSYMTRDGRMFGIGPASRKMIEQLQMLFLNFGILSRVHRAAERAWSLTVAGNALEKLAAFVEFDEVWKNERIAIRNENRGQRLHNYADLMPRAVTEHLRTMQESSAKSLRSLYGEQTQDYQRARVNLLSNHRLDRDLARGIFAHFDDVHDEYLAAFFANDKPECIYLSVEAIESGFSNVYDLSVPGSHTFIANGLGNHNTCNFPEGATESDVAKAYMLGWKLGCKGLTVYVTGSREKVVLETHATAKAKEEAKSEATPAALVPAETGTQTVPAESNGKGYKEMEPQLLIPETKKPRPRRLEGRTYRVGTPLGGAYVTVNENGKGKGQPFELFIHTSKAGSETAAISEALGRLSSLILRMSSPISPRDRVKEIIKQLEGIGGERSIGFGAMRVRSLPDGIAQVLREYLDETADVEGEVMEEDDMPPMFAPTAPKQQMALKIGDLCPECGEASVVNEEGCRKCYSCGYSEC
jgi:ribonucleoside-diphosphate reductase alpha chain